MSDESIGTGTAPDEQDQELISAVAGMLDRVDPPPGWMVDLAKLSFDLRSIDAELAELVADSLMDEPLVGVRSAAAAPPRMLTFERGDWALEVESIAAGSGWQLIGQVVPMTACRVEVIQQAGRRILEADDLGRFLIDGVAAEPVMLVVDAPGHPRISTGWFSLGRVA